MACNVINVSTQLTNLSGRPACMCGITFTDPASSSGSLNEEVKGLKGHRTGMSKIVGRQLATERFTEPREAIVTRFRKRTPTPGGLAAREVQRAISDTTEIARLTISLLPAVGDCGRAAWLLTPRMS